MRRIARAVWLTSVGVASVASLLGAQTPIPVRALTRPIATDSGFFASIVDLRVLSDGHVLVNDFLKRRVTMLDSALRLVHNALADGDGSVQKYGGTVGVLVPYVADSTIFVDQESQSFLVINPLGKVVKAIAPPKASDLNAILGRTARASFDQSGQLFYRSTRGRSRPPGSAAIPDSGVMRMLPVSDSAPIVRASMLTRSVDTVAMIHIGVNRTALLGVGHGQTLVVTLVNPLRETDGWTLLPDGTVAIVRAHDYHIDWLSPNGVTRSSPKMPFDWRRVSLADKTRMLDSLVRRAAALRAKEPALPPVAPGQRPEPRAPFMTVKPGELPDYYPPIQEDQVRADADGNVWILPNTSSLSSAGMSGLLYDVVNRNGQIRERVRLPQGRALAGFGRDGVVYMTYSSVAQGHRMLLLERAKVIR